MSAAGFHEKPILVATGSGEGDKHRLVRSVFHIGADSFIAKPFGANLKEVIDQIAAALERGGRSDHRICEDARRGIVAEAKSEPAAAGATGTGRRGNQCVRPPARDHLVAAAGGAEAEARAERRAGFFVAGDPRDARR